MNSHPQVSLPRDVKWSNRQKLLQILKNGKPVTVAVLHEQTGLSRPTVMKALQEYCEQGIVKSLGLGNTTSLGGKKPELFVFSDNRKLLSVALWPEHITLSLCGLTDSNIVIRSYPGDWKQSLEALSRQTDIFLQEFLREMNVQKSEICSVAISVPGAVNQKDHILLYNVKAPSWGKNIDMESWVRKLLPDVETVYLDNAGKAVGRELLRRDESSDSRLVSVFTTWGVSACLIEKGHVLSGRNSLIGEIGHMIIDSNSSRSCACGKKGCLESMVSLPVAAQKLTELGEIVPEKLTYPDFFEQSAKGNSAYQQVSRYLAHCFAVALHNLALSYNQDVVIFQGDFAWADDVFAQCLIEELNEFHYFPEGKPFDIFYDRRNLQLLAATGDLNRLKNDYFAAIDGRKNQTAFWRKRCK